MLMCPSTSAQLVEMSSHISVESNELIVLLIFLDKLMDQSIMEYDPNKYNIGLQSISIVLGTTCRIFTRNDNDVQFMLGQDRVILQVYVSLIKRRCGGRHVQGALPRGSAPDMSGTSDVPKNLNLLASDNPSTWVIPGSEAYSFGQVNNTMGSHEPNTMIYKGASIRGFRWCMRPVIAVDSTFLKGRRAGIMFVAATQDGNEQAYPIAFGCGNS
ncbi:hypothetical protein Dsin_027834 [Dipteronia sinensis]|uniref:Uncharacterized protein n=1 Tax=Dipteronia sinensis TaxID=43782 RepID=A0AAE0DTN6_9ROSI|nr:hypothetical protein Dsin_027834 [Dipteronia sinensis]